CAKVSSPQLADYAFLADYARLKNKNHNVIMFYLLCFKNTLGQLSLNSTTEIGEKPVFRSFSLQTFIPSDPGHILLRLAFFTAEGSDIEFYLQNSPDTAPRQIVSGQESADSSIAVTDINDDGIADIILSHKQAEDGIGYETTMRWYRFNGKTYALFKTTSIVRNLKNFLGNIKTMLSGGQISRFVTYAVEPQSLKALRKKGSSDSRIALRALNMDSLVSQSGLSVYNFMKRIKELVFPDILENPFISKSSLGRRFKLTFKIIDTDNIPFISESLLYLNKNPFGPHQFFFNP
ncbi:MAG: hypothetical protein P8107_01790, partial [Spirochaetia bacterium]